MSTKALVLVAWIIGVGSVPLAAHHAAFAEFDSTKPFEFTGVVTKVLWENPHVFFYIDVKDEETGEMVNWAMEMQGLNRLIRAGWRRDDLPIGAEVTVTGNLAKSGNPLGQVRGGVTLTATGEELFGR